MYGVRNWRYVPNKMYGVEAWPGFMWKPEHAGVIFKDNSGDNYQAEEMQNVLREFSDWKVAHADRAGRRDKAKG